MKIFLEIVALVCGGIGLFCLIYAEYTKCTK